MRQEQNNEWMYSSTVDSVKTLAKELPKGRAEGFLRELVNLRETDRDAVSRFQARYSEFILDSPEYRKIPLVGTAQSGLAVAGAFPRMIFNLQYLLRRAWDRPTAFDREVHLGYTLNKVYEQFIRATEKRPVEGTPQHKVWKSIGFIVVGLTLARRVVDLMRRCENSDCPAPYFIAKRRTQKFCSEVCAAPAQREYKNAWWREHGKEWRQDRNKS